MLHDVKGKPQKALKIFSCIIQGLREDFTARLTDQIPNFGAGPVDHDIHWVITVPAIWDEKAKQFMRVAAKEVSLSEIEYPMEEDIRLSFLFYLWPNSNQNAVHN